VTTKLIDPRQLVERLDVADGMTIGIGGWGSRRKPMMLVRALIRSGARDLTLVSFGGPDVGLLCATGQATKVIFGFATLDSIAIEPHFARARESGDVEVMELDEAMLVAGLRAAARRLPFEVTRSGLGSDALRRSETIKTIKSPYADGEELVAMPAINLDLALIHLSQSDDRGNAVCLSPDPYFDDLFARAATRTILSVEEVVETGSLGAADAPARLVVNRTLVHGVVAAPRGAHFTAFPPHYERDEVLQQAYAESAETPDGWRDFRDKFLDPGVA
jgi:glutaconate CoA-transferase, subunit A